MRFFPALLSFLLFIFVTELYADSHFSIASAELYDVHAMQTAMQAERSNKSGDTGKTGIIGIKTGNSVREISVPVPMGLVTLLYDTAVLLQPVSFRNISVQAKGAHTSYDLYRYPDRPVMLDGGEIITLLPKGVVTLVDCAGDKVSMEIYHSDKLTDIVNRGCGAIDISMVEIYHVEGSDRKQQASFAPGVMPDAEWKFTGKEYLVVTPQTSTGGSSATAPQQGAAEGTSYAVPVYPQESYLKKSGVTVRLEGEFAQPGVYTVSEGEKLSEVIRRAGGFTKTAFPEAAYLVRSSDTTITSQHIARAAEEVPGTVRQMEYSGDAKKVSVPLAHPRLMKNTKSDIILHDGDVIVLPRRTNTVSVTGEVLRQGAHLYSSTRTLVDYIGLSGGVTEKGDVDASYVVKADGSIAHFKRGFLEWNPKLNRLELPWMLGDKPVIEAGDTIVVPAVQK